MGNEDLSAVLLEKFSAEQDKYREWLLSQPPEEILNHTYEYTVREDILCTVENGEFPEKWWRRSCAGMSPSLIFTRTSPKAKPII